MTNAIVTLVCVSIIVVAVITLTDTSFYTVDVMSEAWKDMEDRSGTRSRTEIENMEENSCDGANVTITLKNDGEVPIADFSDWDVLVQYYNATSVYLVKYLSYDSTDPPSNNQWSVEGIYTDASASSSEIYEPNILNPGEEVKINMKLNPVVGNTTTNCATVSTPTGITTEILFSGP